MHTPTMTSWRQHRYGGPERVIQERVATPTPGAHDVLVRMRAASINAGDIRVMRGEPLLIRAFFGLRAPRERGRGMDAAGNVVAVGAEVTEFAIGDEVVGELSGGSLSDYVVTPASRLVHRPPAVDPVIASTLPLAGGTAWQALDAAQLGTAELDAASRPARVLIIGASGGVGHFTVKLAKLRGAEVWALCGERNRSIVESWGADRTFDYRQTQVSELPQGSFDAIIDIAGTAPLRELRALLRTAANGNSSAADRSVKGSSSLISVAGDGGRVFGPIGRIAWGALLSRNDRRIRPLAASAKTEITRQLLDLAASGRLEPHIERVFERDEAGAALAHVDRGRTVGKVVVTMR